MFSDGSLGKGFKLETHMHTKESSLCGQVSAESMVRMFKLSGYDGIIVTDHFINGNTAVDRSLPWDEQMDAFFRGYELAYEAGKKYDLKVFPGLEYNYKTTEFIILGLGKEWFKQNQQVMDMKPEEFIPFFQKAGGFVIHVHPFREASYITGHRYYPLLVDAVEVLNLGNTDPAYNELAYRYAIEYKKPMTAGSDAHHFGVDYGAGIVMDKAPNDIYDIINTIRSGKGYSLFGGAKVENNQRMLL